MAVRRKRRAARSSGRGGSVTSRVTVTGAMSGGGDLGAAAAIVADEAKRLASWSEKIPGSISVEVSGNTATISSAAGPAYPNEIAGVRHPTFGHEPWVTNQHRPFLAPAADAAADKAMARYADKIDGWARKAGYR